MAKTRESTRTRIWLSLLVLAGTLVRLIGLTRESFWNDEAFSGWTVQLPTLTDVWAVARTDVHPPGHLILGWFWGRVFGVNDFSLRATSALAGIIAIPIVFRLGRQLFGDTTAWIGAILMAFLTMPIYYSQEFRAYMPVACLLAVAATLIIDIARAPERLPVGKSIGVGVALIAASYLHYFGLLMSLILVVVCLLCRLRDRRMATCAVAWGAALILAYLPWVPEALAATSRRAYVSKPTAKDVALVSNVIFGPGMWLNALAGLVLLAGIVLALTRRQRTFAGELKLIGWIALPLALSLIISYLQVPVFTPRNMFLVVVPAVLLLARALELVGRPRFALVACFGFLVVHHALQFRHEGYFLHPTKQQLREATAYAANRVQPGEEIRVVDWDEQNIGYYLAQTPAKNQLKVFHADPDSDFTAEWRGTFWYVYAGIVPKQLDKLGERFQILDQADFLGAHVLKLSRQ